MDIKKIREMYASCRTTRGKYESLWQDVTKYAAIQVDTQDFYSGHGESNANISRDNFIDDPSAAIALVQYSDYMSGIMWGTGQNAMTVVPSNHVLEKVDHSNVAPYYKYATEQTLYHFNHHEAGLHNCLRSYAYDDGGIGTAGVGCFKNPSFKTGRDDFGLLFRYYGVDTMCFEEGRGGSVEVIFNAYEWKTLRIVQEFAMPSGVLDKDAFSKLPKEIRDCWDKKDFNKKHRIVYCLMPRDDYSPGLRGKRGMRYVGVWFAEKNDGDVFYEEDYSEKPIAVGRSMKYRNEIYGRGTGTQILATIKMTNHLMSMTSEAIEGLVGPAMGMYGKPLSSDIIDFSFNALNVFDPDSGVNGTPIFPMRDTGDPSGIIQFLLPYLNEKIASAFKLDTLLDFNSDAGMTATESMQRYSIRGKSLSASLVQKKNDVLYPMGKRGVTALYELGALGVDPRLVDKNLIKPHLRDSLIIPMAVIEVAESGKPWFDLKFNNELEKLVTNERIQGMMMFLQVVQSVASVEPKIIMAVNWYKFCSDLKDMVAEDASYFISKDDYEAAVNGAAAMQENASIIQSGLQSAQAEKLLSEADKNRRV